MGLTPEMRCRDHNGVFSCMFSQSDCWVLPVEKLSSGLMEVEWKGKCGRGRYMLERICSSFFVKSERDTSWGCTKLKVKMAAL